MEPLRVLVLEQSVHKAELLMEALRHSGYEPEWRRATSEEQFRAHVSGNVDVIIADYGYSPFDPRQALEILREGRFAIPLILVLGSGERKAALEVTRDVCGPDVLQHPLPEQGLLEECLGPAVRRALTRREVPRRRFNAQEFLLASEQRFQTAFEHAPNGMSIMTLEGRFVSVNPALCRMLGYSAAELAGMTVWDITHPDDRLTDRNWLEGFGDRELPPTAREKRNVKKDGSVIWVSVSRSMVRDLSGAPWYLIGQVQDITARRQAEMRVQRLSRLYAAMSEAHAAIVKSCQQEEVFRTVCRACVQHGDLSLAWVGIRREDGTMEVTAAAGPAMGYLDRLAMGEGGDACMGQDPAEIAFRSNQPYICNDYAAGPAAPASAEGGDGRALRSCMALPLHRGGEVIGAFTAYGGEANVFDDETVALLTKMAATMSYAMDRFASEQRRQEAEAALKASEARLRRAQVLGRMGDWELDLSSGRFTWSAQAARLFEHDPAAPMPTLERLLDHYVAESAQAVRDGLARAEKMEVRVDLEVQLVLPGGNRAWHAVVIVPIVEPGGRVARLQGTVQDITERKLEEAERVASALRLAKLSSRLVTVEEEERRRLAAELHDCTSPNLAAVMLNFEMLGTDLPAPCQRQIEARLEDTRALLEDTIAAIRNTCADLRPALLDYAGLVPALESYAGQYAARTGSKVAVEAGAPRPRLSKEQESLLFRIAQEALANCAKHAGARNIAINLQHADGRTVMKIIDDGVGFDVDALGRQGDQPGLGLLTMKERAEFAGGSFHVVSVPGEGTTITVALG